MRTATVQTRVAVTFVVMIMVNTTDTVTVIITVTYVVADSRMVTVIVMAASSTMPAAVGTYATTCMLYVRVWLSV